jgi:hypothetical protein
MQSVFEKCIVSLQKPIFSGKKYSGRVSLFPHLCLPDSQNCRCAAPHWLSGVNVPELHTELGNNLISNRSSPTDVSKIPKVLHVIVTVRKKNHRTHQFLWFIYIFYFIYLFLSADNGTQGLTQEIHHRAASMAQSSTLTKQKTT